MRNDLRLPNEPVSLKLPALLRLYFTARAWWPWFRWFIVRIYIVVVVARPGCRNPYCRQLPPGAVLA